MSYTGSDGAPASSNESSPRGNAGARGATLLPSETGLTTGPRHPPTAAVYSSQVLLPPGGPKPWSSRSFGAVGALTAMPRPRMESPWDTALRLSRVDVGFVDGEVVAGYRLADRDAYAVRQGWFREHDTEDECLG
jgi:hypothetical protein